MVFTDLKFFSVAHQNSSVGHIFNMVKIYEIGLVDSDKGVMIGEAFFNIIYFSIKFKLVRR